MSKNAEILFAQHLIVRPGLIFFRTLGSYSAPSSPLTTALSVARLEKTAGMGTERDIAGDTSEPIVLISWCVCMCWGGCLCIGGGRRKHTSNIA